MTEKTQQLAVSVPPSTASSLTNVADQPPVVRDDLEKDPAAIEKIQTQVSVQDANPSLRAVATREDGEAYPSGAKLALILLALCLCVFLVSLDNSIIATAIPEITNEFHSLGDVAWYGSAYLLTTAAFQLLFGKLYTYLNIKWVYIAAIAIFEIGSLICGVAPNSTALIVGRAIAGIGGAGLFSGSLLILAHSVPLEKRPTYTGLIGGMYGIASVAGPLMGGAFTDHATWRWCFYINLPIGAITVGVIILFFKTPHVQRSGEKESAMTIFRRFDPIGTLLFMPAIICLLLALQWGGAEYAWSDGRIIALLTLFSVLIICFVIAQILQGEFSTVPMRIMTKRSVWAAAIYAFTLGASMFIVIYYLPIWFQAVKGASAVRSGIMNLPFLLGVVVSSIMGGILVTQLGYYAPLMIAATVIGPIGIGLLSTMEPDTGSPKWIGFQILGGFGLGLGLQQPLIAVQAVLDIQDVPTGTAIAVFMQTLGGALFVSVGQNVFNKGLVAGVTNDIPSLDLQTVLHTGATRLQTEIPTEFLPALIKVYSDSLTETFLAAAIVAAISIVGSLAIEWVSVKGKTIEAAAA